MYYIGIRRFDNENCNHSKRSILSSKTSCSLERRLCRNQNLSNLA